MVRVNFITEFAWPVWLTGWTFTSTGEAKTEVQVRMRKKETSRGSGGLFIITNKMLILLLK